MRGTAENQIKFISKKLVRSFFIDRKLDYLFSLLAADVYYLGAGKNMKYTTKRIGWEHWLCEVVCDLQVTEESREAEQECLHEALLFRRRKDAKIGQNPWELVFIHNSITTKWFSPEEMLAIQQANRTRRNTHLYNGLTDREKKLVRMIRSGIQIRDIAAEFGLAEITIKKALAKLYQRYNVKNRSRLCAYFDAEENNF